MGVAKRLRYFQVGANAISRYTGDDTYYYCPICGDAFVVADAQSGLLTLEHVPPKSQGGKAILLTCKRCNSKSGHTIDAHLVRHDELINFAKHAMGHEAGESQSVLLEIGGHEVRIRLRQDGELLRMEVIHDINNPSDLEAFYQHLQSLSEEGRWDGTQMRLTKRVPLDERLRKLAHLKSAFLLLVAQLGYRYAFDERLLPVRRQLLDPYEDIIGTNFWFTLDKEAELERVIIIVNDPAPLLVVANGREGVIMPHLSSPSPFYNWISEKWDRGAKINLTGTATDWPEEMRMIQDFL